MRRSSQDRHLPPWTIQVFGMVIVAVVVAAVVTEKGDTTGLLGVLALAGTFVLLNGIYERIRQTVDRRQDPAPPEDEAR